MSKKQTACHFSESSDNLTQLKTLTKELRFSEMMIERTGSQWVEVNTPSGKAFIRGLLKIDEVAVVDNYSAPGTLFPEHQHPAHEVFIVYRGTLNLKVAGKEITLTADGKPYYFDARQVHSAYFENECQYIAVTIPADKDWPEGG